MDERVVLRQALYADTLNPFRYGFQESGRLVAGSGAAGGTGL